MMKPYLETAHFRRCLQNRPSSRGDVASILLDHKVRTFLSSPCSLTGCFHFPLSDASSSSAFSSEVNISTAVEIEKSKCSGQRQQGIHLANLGPGLHGRQWSSPTRRYGPLLRYHAYFPWEESRKIRTDTTHDLRDMECNCQLDCTSENAKATAANRSLFLKPTGLVIKTCNLVMSVVKNEIVSTAHGSECYPCAGCHAMYECCPQFFGLLLGELSHESIQHFDTPHLRIFPNPNVVKACKLAFWLWSCQYSAAWEILFGKYSFGFRFDFILKFLY